LKFGKRLSVLLSVSLLWSIVMGNGGYLSAQQETSPATVTAQNDIKYMKEWPSVPEPFHIRDWKQTANNFYDLIFNPEAAGPSLPLIRMVQVNKKTDGGFSGETFSMPSYLNAWNKGNYAKSYVVQTSSNGNDWKEVFRTSSDNGGTEEIDFAVHSARYVRIQMSAIAPGKQHFELVEVEVYDETDSNVALDRTVSASSAATGANVEQATDGSLSAGWKSNTNSDEWLSVDLGSSQKIDKLKLMWASPYGEGVNSLAAVMGATLMGRDMRDYTGKDWVKMIENYYSVTNGKGFVSNGPSSTDSTESFWYDLYPTLLFSHIASLYPEEASINDKLLDVADSWLEALNILNDNWEHTGFSFKGMKVTDTGRWTEPDAVIGIGYLEYMAYLKTGEQKYLDAAQQSMQQASSFNFNPYYEIVGSYGPYLAARMNAEEGTSYPLNKFLDWVFTESSDRRSGWGTMTDRWGNYDAYGLQGSTSDTSGYAFAMNTFVTAGAVAPTARYAPEYSKAIAKYLLNAVNNSSLFFPDGLPKEMQKNYAWSEAANITDLAYEGVRNKGDTQPYGTGDWPEYFGVYSTAPIGMLAAITEKTNIPEILQIDLLKTDFSKKSAYPTYLYYNPLTVSKSVQIDVGSAAKDLYNALTGEFVATNVHGQASFEISADQVVQIVILPSSSQLTRSDNKVMVNGITVAYETASVHVQDLANGDMAEGTIPLSISARLPEGDKLRSLSVKLGDAIIYEGADIPQPLLLDTTLAENGKQMLNVMIESENGLKATSSVVLAVRNLLGEVVLKAGSSELAKWKPDQTTVTEEADGAAIKVNTGHTWGTLASGSFELDFDRLPVLKLDVAINK